MAILVHRMAILMHRMVMGMIMVRIITLIMMIITIIIAIYHESSNGAAFGGAHRALPRPVGVNIIILPLLVHS